MCTLVLHISCWWGVVKLSWEVVSREFILPYLTTCLGCISISFLFVEFLFQLLPAGSLRKERRSVFGIQLWIKAVRQVVVQFVAAARDFFSCKASRPALGPTHPHWVSTSDHFPQGVKQLEHAANHSSPSIADVKNVLRMSGSIPLLPYIHSWHVQGYVYFALLCYGWTCFVRLLCKKSIHIKYTCICLEFLQNFLPVVFRLSASLTALLLTFMLVRHLGTLLNLFIPGNSFTAFTF